MRAAHAIARIAGDVEPLRFFLDLHARLDAGIGVDDRRMVATFRSRGFEINAGPELDVAMATKRL
jgi:hypothetical protein